MDVCIAYVTCPDRGAAEQLARTLLEERLIACANVIDGVTSLYRWEGEVRQESETVLILKTPLKLLPSLIARINELHVYDCPCVAAWPITNGNPEFLKWVEAETVSPRDLMT